MTSLPAVLCLIGLIASAPSLARADDAPVAITPSLALPGATDESQAEARRYTELRHLDQTALAGMAASRTEMIGNLIERYKFTPEAAGTYFDCYILPEARLKIGDFVDLYVAILASKFTADELRQLEAFLSTPIGAKFLSAQDELTRELTTAQYAWRKRVSADAYEKFKRDTASAANKPVIHN